MFSRKRIALFVVLSLGYYGLLTLVPWPGLREAYAGFYRAAGNLIFGSFGSEGMVRFEPLSSGPRVTDTDIIIRKRHPPVDGSPHLQGRVNHSSWLIGYLPLAECSALILATPIPWQRRWKALLWGLILVNVFVVVRIWIVLLYWFGIDAPWALYDPSLFWGQVVSGLRAWLVKGPTCSFVIPALIWMLVCFRPSDFKAAIGDEETPSAAMW